MEQSGIFLMIFLRIKLVNPLHLAFYYYFFNLRFCLAVSQTQEILIENNKATGVRTTEGFEIRAKHGVISTAGYDVTYNKLVSEDVCKQFAIPRKLPLQQSAGFVMVNLGIKGSAKELGLTNVNTWYHPVDKEYDILPPLLK